MWGNSDGWGHGIFGVLWGIGSAVTAFVVFLIWIAILVLLVRFLLIATRAAKLYLTQNGHDAGILPKRPTAPVPPAAASTPRTTATPPASPATPATKPRTTPRKPPAAS